MNRASIATLLGLAILAGCRSMEITGDVPARITDPTVASRVALRNAVNDALHTEVLLADDAFTDASVLVLERRPSRTMQDLPANGRIMEQPIKLQLVKNGHDCILIDTRDRSRHVLENTTCVSE